MYYLTTAYYHHSSCKNGKNSRQLFKIKYWFIFVVNLPIDSKMLKVYIKKVNLFEDENLTINWLLKEFLHTSHDLKPTLKINRKNKNSDFLIPIRLLRHGHLLFGFTTIVYSVVSVRFNMSRWISENCLINILFL